MTADRLAIEPPPTSEEAAAIAAAIARFEVDTGGADEDADPEGEGRRWGFAGRVEQLTDRRVLPPKEPPEDPWRAMGRLVRR